MNHEERRLADIINNSLNKMGHVSSAAETAAERPSMHLSGLPNLSRDRLSLVSGWILQNNVCQIVLPAALSIHMCVEP